MVFPEVFSVIMKINTEFFLKILPYRELDDGFQRNLMHPGLSFLLSVLISQGGNAPGKHWESGYQHAF